MDQLFNALIVEQQNDGTYSRSIQKRSLNSLPHHDVLIKAHYSALNYKDALSAIGNKGVTRHYPHTPGIDAAGVIVSSDDKRFKQGDKVLVTGYDLGMNTSGGFGEYISVPGDWIIPLPDGLTLKESMMIGTAGFTAAYGIVQIIDNEHSSSDTKKALVTGATGGVASLGIAIFANAGFDVIAATGKTDHASYLQNIGASNVINRNEVYQSANKPLLSRRWDVALDTVGGEMLDAILRQTEENGTIACCGNILGGSLQTSIYPFILRGVNLMGINSATCPKPMRQKLWTLLADDWKPTTLDIICRECSLEEINEEIDKILEGEQVGKVVLKHNL